MNKEMLIVSMLVFTLFSVSFVGAVTCQGDILEGLRKALYDYYSNPQGSSMSVDDLKDLLNLYLSGSSECSAEQNSKIASANALPDKIPTCSDGTKYGRCSSTKPMYCYAGNLVPRCNLCGCPAGQECDKTYVYTERNNKGQWGKCNPPSNLTCSDGTTYGQCSTTKPKYCENGNLIDKCSVCGCSTGTCQADGTCGGPETFDRTLIFIADATGGDCALVGTWDSGTKTCTLTKSFTSNQSSVAEIQGGGITIDCAGHKINGDLSNKCIWSTTRYASNIVIKNCVFEHCHQGIRCYDGQSHIYEKNTFIGKGSGSGIVGYRIGSSTIRNNEIYHQGTGISMELTQRNNNVYDNYIHDNGGAGIYWTQSSSTYDESVYNNILEKNGVGIQSVGTWIKVYHNDFKDNTRQALSTSAYSSACGYERWDNGAEGNYWSDYSPTCVDSNGNNICDNPYNVPCGDGNSLKDNYPLKNPFNS